MMTKEELIIKFINFEAVNIDKFKTDKVMECDDFINCNECQYLSNRTINGSSCFVLQYRQKQKFHAILGINRDYKEITELVKRCKDIKYKKLNI